MPLSKDAHANLGYSTVATAPAPALTGTSLVVTAGEGTRFPATPFNATVWAAGEVPTPANAEIVRVTAITGSNTFTIARAQEGTAQRAITVGDQIAATITKKTLTDIEDSLSDLLSTHDVLSNRVSGLAGGGGSVTSNEVSAVSAQAASAISDLRSAHNALSQAVSAASVLSTGGVPTAGLQAVLNALSNRISLAGAGGVSVTSNEASAISAQAKSAIDVVSNAVSIVSNALSNEISNRVSAANALSNSISIVSNALSNEISNRTSAQNALSQAISVVSQQVSVLSQQVSVLSQRVSILFSGVSVLSTGGISTHGMQSILNALSNRISLAGVGGVSVTSNEASAISAQAASAINVVSNAVSIVSTAASNALSVGNAASNAASIVSNALSNEISNRISADNVLSQAVSVISQQVSILSQQVSVLSQAHSVLSQAHSVLSQLLSAGSARSVGNISTHGYQSVIDALSNRISALVAGVASVTSNEASAISAQAASAINVVSNATSIVSQALSVETAARISVVNVVSNQASIALQGVSVLSQQVSVLSQQVSVITAALSNLTSATNAASNKLSNLVSVVDVVSNLVSLGAYRFVTVTGGTQSIALSTLTDVSGMVMSLSAGETWEITGQFLVSISAVAAGMRVGVSVGPLSSPRYMYVQTMGPGPLNQQAGPTLFAGAQLAVSGTQVIMSAGSIASAGGAFPVQFGAVVNCASAGTFRLQLAVNASATASPINIMPGAYMKAFRLKP